jgi:arylsulfatase A-like enzyme
MLSTAIGHMRSALRCALAVLPMRRPSPQGGAHVQTGRARLPVLLWVVAAAAIGAIAIVAVNKARDKREPNVLLITIDALRADAVGYASKDAPPTPEIDQLAARGVAFSAAFAQSPWTLPSFAAMMTSRYPSEVGVALVRDASGHAKPGKSHPLTTAAPTLAELLRDAGYSTAAHVSNVNLAEDYGITRGIVDHTHYSDKGDPFSELVDAEHITGEAIRWLERHSEERFFLWVHYMDVHEPYGAPGSGAPTGDDWYALEDIPGDKTASSAAKLEAMGTMRELYRDGVTYCDRWVGELVRSLDALDVADRTIIVFTADHGEEFREHEFWGRRRRGHGRSLNDEVLRVPFVIAFDDGRQAGRRVSEPIRLLDVMPTLLEMAGVEPPADLRGRSLMPLVNGSEDGGPDSRELLAECLYGGDELKGIRARDSLTTYRSKDGEFRESSREPLWPRSRESSPEASRSDLRERLLGWSADMDRALSATKGAAPDLSPEQEKELKALGYL